MKLLFAPILVLVFFLAGCSSPCVPAAAYTIPAHWTQSYYSQEQAFSHWHYYTTCSGYGSNRSCYQSSYPVYYYYQQYHPAVYHPTEFVPAVVCAATPTPKP